MDDKMIDAPDERLVEDVEAWEGTAPAGAEYLTMPGWVVTEKAETRTYKRTQWAHDGVSAYHYGGSIEFRFWWSHGGTYRAACRAQDFARVFGGETGPEIGQGGRGPRGVLRAGQPDTVEWRRPACTSPSATVGGNEGVPPRRVSVRDVRPRSRHLTRLSIRAQCEVQDRLITDEMTERVLRSR